MLVTSVRPVGGYTWTTRALGHTLDYGNLVRSSGPTTCMVDFTAEVHGPLASLVERLVGRLSAFGQRRRIQRLAVLAEGWRRIA